MWTKTTAIAITQLQTPPAPTAFAGVSSLDKPQDTHYLTPASAAQELSQLVSRASYTGKAAIAFIATASSFEVLADQLDKIASALALPELSATATALKSLQTWERERFVLGRPLTHAGFINHPVNRMFSLDQYASHALETLALTPLPDDALTQLNTRKSAFMDDNPKTNPTAATGLVDVYAMSLATANAETHGQQLQDASGLPGNGYIYSFAACFVANNADINQLKTGFSL
jgi:hypothetical protein